MIDLGILTQAAAILLEREPCTDHPNNRAIQAQRLGSIVLPTAGHVGAVNDRQSNKLMADIGGPLFSACFMLLRSLTNRSPYEERYPRPATPEDKTQAQRVDALIAMHAADFIGSEQGAYLLRPVTNQGGCPMKRTPHAESGRGYFDLLALRTVDEFLDQDSPFFRIGYYGIAQSIVASNTPTEAASFRQSNPSEYNRIMEEYCPGGEQNWQLPDPEMRTEV